jgi:pilus assembly protein CpaF
MISRTGLDGFGPLARFLDDPRVTDVFVNGYTSLWVDSGHGLVPRDDWYCPDEGSLRQLAVRLISLGGRHLDEATPCVDVRLLDGIRVHVAVPPIARAGTMISIRIPPPAKPRIADLYGNGLIGGGEPARALARLISESVALRTNVLITGAGGSGKTTFLSAYLGEAPASERIIAVEDVAELRVDHPHFVALEARQSNLEGAGAIGLDRLIREALRMRPDRLILGECRGQEIRELLMALNTGHDGGAGTLHANSLEDVPARLEALGALAGFSTDAMARQTVSAIGLVIHLERRGGLRRIAAVGKFDVDRQGRLRIRRGRSVPRRTEPEAGLGSGLGAGLGVGTSAGLGAGTNAGTNAGTSAGTSAGTEAGATDTGTRALAGALQW